MATYKLGDIVYVTLRQYRDLAEVYLVGVNIICVRFRAGFSLGALPKHVRPATDAEALRWLLTK